MSVVIVGIMGCGGGGGESSDNPPDVAGTYTQTNAEPAECATQIDSEVKVVQDGNDVIVQPVHSGFSDLTGTISNDGDFTGTDSEGTTCTGQYVSGVISVNCTNGGNECDLTYTRQ
jgi:hypothetical protein